MVGTPYTDNNPAVDQRISLTLLVLLVIACCWGASGFPGLI